MKIGTRVRVQDGDGTTDRGLGTYQGESDVYALRAKGVLLSLHDATNRPEPEEGQELATLYDNPRILLDSGETVYGCQVWWQPVDEETLPLFAPDDPHRAGAHQAVLDLKLLKAAEIDRAVRFWVDIHNGQQLANIRPDEPAYLRARASFSRDAQVFPNLPWEREYARGYLVAMRTALQEQATAQDAQP